MLHAKAFVRDGEHVLAGTCNLETWSLKRYFEINVEVRSTELAAQFDELFHAPAAAVLDARPTRSRERRSGPARRHSRSCRRCSDPPRSPVWAVRG